MNLVQCPSQIIIRDSEGNVILDVEPFDIDVLVAEAQEGIDTSAISSTIIWIQRLQQRINEQFEVNLTRTQTWQLYEAVRHVMYSIKKNILATQTLPNSTESIPTPSPENNS